MEEIILEVETRKEKGRSQVKKLRDEGFIPGVIYSEGKEALPIKIPHGEFIRLFHEYRLESMVLTIKIKNDEQNPRSCMIKEIQHEPVHDEITHLDLIGVSLTRKIEVNVPVVTRGEPIGVKQEGGSLEHSLWEIEIECLPTQIPKHFEIDVSNLKTGEAIHIKDMVFSADIKVLNDPDVVVVAVSAPMKEEAAEAEEGKESAEPEVIKEKKEAAPSAEE